MNSRRIGMALLAVSTLAVCVVVVTEDSARFPQSSARMDLLHALGPLRPVPGRITGLAYAIYPTTLAETITPGRSAQLRAASRRINQELSKSSRATSRANQALLRMADGNLSMALQGLEEAARLAPGDGLLQSDLCALLLEQAKRGNPEAFFDALTAAHHAVDIAPESLPARFNLALALEENGLRETATEGWTEYLRRDPRSPWAIEARRHLALVEEPNDARLWEQLSPRVADAAASGELTRILPLSLRFPSEIERDARKLLDHWAYAFARGDRNAAEAALVTARFLSQAIESTNKVSMTSDAVAVLDNLDVVTVSGQSHLLRLAGAQTDLATGEQLCLNQGTGGPDRLERSRAAFAEVGSPLEYQAIYSLAVCAYEHSHYRQAIARLLSLLARPKVARYTGLVGKANSIIGMCYLASGRPDLSLGAYEIADQISKLNGAMNEIGYTAYLLSENLRYLGERRASLHLLHTAATAAVKSGDDRSLYRVFDGLAEEASRRGAARVAFDFRHEVLRVAQRAADRSQLQEAGLAHAWLRQGEARLALSDTAGARRDLAAAAHYVGQISDIDARRLREADLLLAQGRLLLANDPRSALRFLTVAVQEKLKTQSFYFLLEALYTRAQAELALGDRAAASEDLSIALQEFERQRGELMSLSLRASYLDRVGQLFDLAIKLAIEEPGGLAAALELAERERARSLLDRTRSPEDAAIKANAEPDWLSDAHRTATKPLPVDVILRRLPEGIAIVEYATLPDRLLVWLLRRGSASALVERRIGAQRMAVLVNQFRQSLESLDTGPSSEIISSELSEALLGSVLQSVHNGERLVFVPDNLLQNLPFAALRDTRTSRYLIEEHAVAVAPSATLFLEGLARDSTKIHAPRLNVLVLGNPSFDRKLHPNLRDLPGAAAEATEVAAIYGTAAELRLGSAASRRALLESAGKHVVVHVASHALANPDFPWLSRLLLAPLGGDDGNLFAFEIEQLRFPTTRLVVLSACETGHGASEGREGTQGLAWAFLAAGVPAVLASLWNVEDLSAEGMLAEFHRSFYTTQDAPGSLRAAQLALLRGPNSAFRSPAVWASFELLGGSAATPQ